MASDWFARVEGDSGFCRGVARLPGRQGAWLSSGAWRRSVSCVSGISGISGILCRNNHRWLQQAARRGEFEEVVDGAEQRPFALHRDEAAPQELAEAACLLDLPEHRFDHLLAQPVGALVPGGAQFCRHRRHPAVRLGGSRVRCRGAVLVPAGGDIRVDVAGFERDQIILRTIAGIG